MIQCSGISRMVATARRETREHGLRGLLRAARDRWLLEKKMYPYRNTKAVILDGCTFDVKHLPQVPMKLVLLDQSYEGAERRLVRKYVRPNLPVIELGGCIGVVACITNKLLDNPAAHVVVEANPKAIPFLNYNRTRNDCGFRIVNAAIAYEGESVAFTPTGDFLGSSLRQTEEGGSIRIPTLRLGDIASEEGFDSFTLVCDIEGYEYELVLNEPGMLRKADTIVLETHARMIGEPATLEVLRVLRQLGFETVDQDSYVYVMRRAEVPSMANSDGYRSENC